MEKKITIESITLSNWRSLNLSVVFDEDTTRISAANGKGKSSLMKAFYWALTGYPAPAENLNFNLFDNRVELTPETPKASVKIILSIDGEVYTIEKVAEAKFTRRRGSSTMEKDSSDVYYIYLDNILTSASDYKQWLETNIAPVDMLPYCLDGGFFVSLLDDKSKARKTLEKVIGDIKEEDMKGDYSILKEDMLRFSIDQIEERTKNELKPYKKRQEEIPAIIDDKEKTLSEYKTIDFGSILNEIEKTKGEIVNIDDAILGKGKEIEPIMGERNRILNLVNTKMVALNDARNAYLEKERAKTIDSKNALQDVWLKNAKIEKDNADKVFAKNNLQSLLDRKRDELILLDAKRTALVAEKDEIKGRVFVADKCAYCGQELPADKIEEARAKFNEKKQQEYENVVSRGKLNKENIETTKKDIEYLEFELSKDLEPVELIDTKPYKEAYDKANRDIVPFERTEEYARLYGEIEAIKATLPDLPENDTTALTSAKKVLMDSIEGLNRQYGLKAKMDEIIDSIEVLRKELREVGIEVAKLEGKIDKCKEYKQEKADIVSYRVNSKLDNCSIDMWSTLKSGELVPDVVLKGKEGIKYASLNMAHQIKTRIELQRLFMSHNEISLPCWIDESSCFDSTNLPKIDGQSIYMFASDSQKIVVE